MGHCGARELSNVWQKCKGSMADIPDGEKMLLQASGQKVSGIYRGGSWQRKFWRALTNNAGEGCLKLGIYYWGPCPKSVTKVPDHKADYLATSSGSFLAT